MNSNFSLFSVSFLCGVGLVACNGTPSAVIGQSSVPGQVVPSTPISSGPSSTITVSVSPSPAPSPLPPTVGAGCQSSDPAHYCLGLKYVAYTDANGQAVVSQDVAISNVQAINKVWSQCNIAYQIDEYLTEDPTTYGLTYSFGSLDATEMTAIRSAFDDSTHLLVVTTGPWTHDSSQANGQANAWTAVPGDGIYGAIIESTVGNYPNIIAHELGHYLSLLHESDPTNHNLMVPGIYPYSTQLTTAQCSSARAAVNDNWKAMLR